jgi:hypothetical protein
MVNIRMLLNAAMMLGNKIYFSPNGEMSKEVVTYNSLRPALRFLDDVNVP